MLYKIYKDDFEFITNQAKDTEYRKTKNQFNKKNRQKNQTYIDFNKQNNDLK